MHPFDFCFYSTKIADNIRDFYCIFHGNNVAINMLVMDFVRFSLRNSQIFVLASHVNMEYDPRLIISCLKLKICRRMDIICNRRHLRLGVRHIL